MTATLRHWHFFLNFFRGCEVCTDRSTATIPKFQLCRRRYSIASSTHPCQARKENEATTNVCLSFSYRDTRVAQNRDCGGHVDVVVVVFLPLRCHLTFRTRPRGRCGLWGDLPRLGFEIVCRRYQIFCRTPRSRKHVPERSTLVKPIVKLIDG
jgi:hypothetical protein